MPKYPPLYLSLDHLLGTVFALSIVSALGVQAIQTHVSRYGNGTRQKHPALLRHALEVIRHVRHDDACLNILEGTRRMALRVVEHVHGAPAPLPAQGDGITLRGRDLGRRAGLVKVRAEGEDGEQDGRLPGLDGLPPAQPQVGRPHHGLGAGQVQHVADVVHVALVVVDEEDRHAVAGKHDAAADQGGQLHRGEPVAGSGLCLADFLRTAEAKGESFRGG